MINTMHRWLISLLVVGSLLTAVPASATAVSSLATQPYDNFHRVTVTTSGGRFAVDLLTISLNNPRLKVYSLTATNGTSCYNKACAVKDLRSYVSERKGFAAINGSYFCPGDYASCAGHAGDFYWSVFNARTRRYVNSSQNRFNNGGAMITFDSTRKWRFYHPTSKYPYLPKLHAPADVDPSASILTAAMSNGPTLMNKKQYVLNPATLDYKSRYVKSNRSGLAVRGTRVYAMVARKATVEDLGRIMQKLGMEYGLNLDGGGSSALWYRGSYKVGPGRNIPNALVFAER